MSKLQFVRRSAIYFEGSRLEVEIEFYKTVAKVYILDETKAFPVVDSYTVKLPKKGFDFDTLLIMAHRYSVSKGYFKHS